MSQRGGLGLLLGLLVISLEEQPMRFSDDADEHAHKET
jgi:hypothetical protein